MNDQQKNIIKNTIAVYETSGNEEKKHYLRRLKRNLEDFPDHKNAKPSKIFLRWLSIKKHKKISYDTTL